MTFRSFTRISLPASILLLSSCGVPVYPTMELVIPDNFKGPFVIVVDPDGEDIGSGHRVRAELPRCGVLRIRSNEALKSMREWRVERENGERVPSEYEIDELMEPRRIAYFSGGSNSRTSVGEPEGFRSEHFIGTAGEFQRFDFSTFRTPKCGE